jgi:hypothetical protein
MRCARCPILGRKDVREFLADEFVLGITEES